MDTFTYLENVAEGISETIHTDTIAKRLGFRRAFVPGTIVALFAASALRDRLGETWPKGGWFDFKFISPVYVDEPVYPRCSATEDPLVVDIHVETADGRLCLLGTAGHGVRPDDESYISPAGVMDAFPRISVGQACRPYTCTMSAQDGANALRAAKLGNSWSCGAETDDGLIVPPTEIFRHCLQATRYNELPLDGVYSSGMWAGQSLELYDIIFYDTTYSIEQVIVAKGQSNRSKYIVFEFKLHNNNKLIAKGRHKAKWLIDRL